MGSLIDEALADPNAFAEKTARLFGQAGWTHAERDIREGRRLRDVAAVRIVREMIGLRMAGKHACLLTFDVECLRHAEALDAARWALERRS